jgi:hypothetical protein
MRSSGESLAHLGLHVGQDWSTWLSTYPDHAPILDISAGSTTVAISITGNKADQAAVEFAGSWPGEPLRSPPRSSGCTPARTAAARTRPARTAGPGMVRRPDDNCGWGGRNGHSRRPGCLPLLAQTERRRV